MNNTQSAIWSLKLGVEQAANGALRGLPVKSSNEIASKSATKTAWAGFVGWGHISPSLIRVLVRMALLVRSVARDSLSIKLSPVQQKATLYSFHPSFAHWAAMLASLKQRTGKDIHEWMAALELAHAATPAEIREFLKSQSLGSSSIGLIVDHAAGKSPGSYDPDAFVAQLFKGPKAALIPLYEAVLHFALDLGGDVKACPCATIVPLYRNHVFAQLKPSTNSRLDLGLALGSLQLSKPKNGHLIDTGGLAKKDRITHRLELGRPADFNDFAKDWLQRAYNADAADKAYKVVSRSNTL